MPESRNLDLVGQLVLDHLQGFVGGAGFEQQLDHVFVGSAVQRTPQRTDGRRHGRVNIGKRRRRDARRKCRRIQLVLGVQDQRNIEGSRHHLIGFLAGERVEKVRGEPQFRIARHHRLPLAQPIETGDDGRGLRHQLHGFLRGGSGLDVVGIGIRKRQHRNRGAQHMHRRAFRIALQERFDLRRNRAIRHQRGLQLIELRLLGQLAVPQQVDDFLERGVLGQRLDTEALVAEQSRIAIDKTQPRFRRDDSF